MEFNLSTLVKSFSLFYMEVSALGIKIFLCPNCDMYGIGLLLDVYVCTG